MFVILHTVDLFLIGGKKKDNKTLCFCFHTDCYNAHTVVSKGHDVTDLILMKADS